MGVKSHFYLMVNYRNHFGNEELQQKPVCMKSERALAGPAPGTFQLFRLFTNAQSNGFCEIDTRREWI